MVEKVCLDSDVIIQLLRADDRTRERIEALDAEFQTTVVNVFEVWLGRKKSEPIDGILGRLTTLVMDEHAARLAADMHRYLKERGQMVDVRDVFIAAMCISANARLFTYNKAHFERFEDFGLVLVGQFK